ncbi:permease-like cell division protein FtsX [Nocardioides sp. AE5]|uniref:permease-like cell division protein FtsX n=1 Tax=Nocardioides sp. AE5 TaxID=2962573 RepID=UPI002880F3E6|nr:permease-like cell division protein FtsX [Nocardioides sp. AE5]MDT0201835.1 permease-like cell division protein FtsX [Nocardioides sp. AE5]
MQLRHVFSELWQGLRRNLTMHIAVVLTLFVSLTLVGMGALLNAEAERAEQQFGNLNQITIFLCNKQMTGQNCAGPVTDAQRDAVIEAIEKSPGATGYRFESQEEAYEKTKEIFSADYRTALPEGFGPESLRESLWVDLDGRDDAEVVTSAVAGLDGVYYVRDLRDEVAPIFKALDVLQKGAIGVAAFLIFAALLLVANTIRLAAFARRREIGIMRLVGASSIYISLPFILEALVTALAGVLLAGGALAAFMQFGIKEGVEPQITFLPWIGWPDYLGALAWIAVVGPLLTLIPTLLVTRKYLKV